MEVKAGNQSYLEDYLEKATQLAAKAHFRLILVTGVSPESSSQFVSDFAAAKELPRINLGIELSAALMDVSSRLRPASVEDCFTEIIGKKSSPIVCLDHLEILFEPSLMLHPLELLKQSSRHMTLVCAWPGTESTDSLTFGQSNHPSFKEFQKSEIECQLFPIHS
jgi:hypothetical protein